MQERLGGSWKLDSNKQQVPARLFELYIKRHSADFCMFRCGAMVSCIGSLKVTIQLASAAGRGTASERISNTEVDRGLTLWKMARRNTCRRSKQQPSK